MILTEKKMSELFPRDDRFLHFVARKNGLFFFCDEDVLTARHYAIIAVNRLYQSKFEFDDEIHLMGVVEQNFRWSIFAMIKHNEALKRSVDIKPESYFGVDGNEDMATYVQLAQSDDSKKMNCDVEYLKTIAQMFLNEDELRLFEMRMDGFTYREMGDKLGGISNERIRTMHNKILRKIKKTYEREKIRGEQRINTPHSKVDVKEIPRRVRNKPSSADETRARDYSEVLSYLDFVQEV